MAEQNVCRYVPREMNEHSIHTVNFVLETERQIYSGLRLKALYTMYLVIKGTGKLHTQGEVRDLRDGDLFFTFPAVPVAIESVDSFQYMYISFLGARGNQLMEKVEVSPHSFLFSDCMDIAPVWMLGINCPADLSDIASEAVLLQTFAYLGGRRSKSAIHDKQNVNLVSNIQKYVDEHFSEPDFTLDLLGSRLRYNKKYLSTVFKKNVGVGIVEYLHSVRVQHACTMLHQGFSSVCDVAFRCGYSDAQYFSKVFKNRIGMSPRAYMEKVRLEADEDEIPQKP
jgi:AraC-like DNA-binding protein